MTEKEMRPIVTKFLKSIDWHCAHESMLCGYYCDIIAFRFKERTGRAIPDLHSTMAVELKVRDINGVIEQAKRNRVCVNTSWAAMPEESVRRMGDKSLSSFFRSGVGLFAVGSDIRVVIPAVVNHPKNDGGWLKRRLWRWEKKIVKANQLWEAEAFIL